MGIVLGGSRGVKGVDDIRLVVELATPTNVVVRAGTILVEGIEYSFAEDQTFEMTSVAEYDQWVDAVLCFDTESGGIVLLVDEFEYGCRDERFDFSRQTKYKLFHCMYAFKIPAGATDLSAVVIEVRHITPNTEGSNV